MATVLILEDKVYTLEFLELLVGKHPLLDKVIRESHFTGCSISDCSWSSLRQ
jgi:hypothetical protein